MKIDEVENNTVYLVKKCIKCGETIFLKYIRTEEYDGGFTKKPKFENPPEGWKYSTELGSILCPKCATEFEVLKNSFINNL